MNDPELLEALKRSIVALKQVKERVRELEGAAREPIAIVGMGCRFAGGVASSDAFWKLLDAGIDAVTPVPRDRWDADALYDPDPSVPGKSVTREGGFLAGDPYGFDAAFFGITPREALGMDPQHRLLMEVVWEALEHAGILPESLMGSPTGVFVGTNLQEYAALESQLETLDGYALTGVSPSIAAGRVSYFLGAKGPSMTLDTACSTSLVAVHYACQSLRAGECETAIAGGAALMLTPSLFVEFSRVRALARDGRSKAFDATADGMGWGEGCGVVVLKRLSSALAAGDRVYAVIRGSAVNQDGRSHGLTAPNGPSQRQLIGQALERAGVAPAEIGYVEAHGTGTPLGDPIELRALAEALSVGRSPADPVLVGSVKTNIGHTIAAAGVAGLIKTVLALHHRRIPRSLHLSTPSPHIPWDALPVRVATEAVPWPSGPKRRVAGVSSFGMSGTNAHVVVEEAPRATADARDARDARDATRKDRAAHVLVVSAKTPDALALSAERYAEHLETRPDIALADLCHAAATTRTHFEERLFVVAASREEASESLRAAARGAAVSGCAAGKAAEGHRPNVAFLFPGQGSQYVGMGRELYDSEPVFREALDQCAKILDPLLERPLPSVLWPAAGAASPLDETRYTQPALFAIEYSLAALWRSWGIVPDVVMGHSVGEYVAACVAGVFSLEDGLKLIAARGRLMHALAPDGEMASVKADLRRVSRAVERYARDVSIGAFNGPEALVISGRREMVRAVCRELEAEGIKTKTLAVSGAPHSPLMDPMLDEFEGIAREMTLQAPRMKLVSNVTGAVAGAEVATPAHWRRHLRDAVRFEQGMKAIRALGVDTFVEAGPQPTLVAMVAAQLAGDGCEWLPSLRKDHPTWRVLLESLGRLHVHGAKIAWSAFDAPFARERVIAPTYAFDRKTYRAPRGGGSSATVSPSELPIFEVAWFAGDEQAEGELARPDVRGRRFIVLADDERRGDRLARRLVSAGASAALATFGTTNGAAARIEELFRATAENGPIDGVVAWWQSGASGASGAHGDEAERAGTTALQALLVIQATARRCVGPHAPRLWLVTEGARAVAAGDRVDVHASVVWGLGRAAMEEHPASRCTLVDLESAVLDPTSESSLDPLWTALGSSDAERETAFRSGKRHVARLVVAQPTVHAAPAAVDLQNATVLVTGGLGALGLRVAEWLARDRGARHLVLVGRSAPAESLRRVEALRAKGVSVVVQQADVALAKDVERVLAAIPAERPLRGVVHAAGVVDGDLLVRLHPSRLDAVLRPKVLGAWNLHMQTRALPLDFFVLFSSIQSILASASQGNYAAANAFLDALAHHRKRAGKVAQSLAWGAWSGEGMAARLDEAQRVGLARVGFGTMTPEVGLSLLARALERSEAALTLARIDLDAIQRSLGDEEAAPMLRALVRPSALRRVNDETARTLRQRLSRAPSAERERVLVDLVRVEVAAALRLSSPAAVPLDRPLKQVGLDSLMAVELTHRLKVLSGGAIPATLLYDHPTVMAVAAFIGRKMMPDVVAADPPRRAAVVDEAAGQPIAIVAMACRAPGDCTTPDALWDLVARGEPAISGPPAHRRWDAASLCDPDPDKVGKTYSLLGGFLHDADAFDPHFFDVSEREATLMDPQQRLLLEVSWEALERAGIPASSFNGSRTGVYAGVYENAYGARAQGSADAHDHTLSLGVRASLASARIAYALGLRGPVMTVDTACSSSLVSLHLACQALRAGECELALAGGATVLASPDLFLESSGQRLLAPDGRCKPFADSADGLVWSEGVGMLVLERLHDALRNGHPILAVVRGSALNHDGRGQGLSVSSGIAQKEVIAAALEAARIEASDVDALEAHGTGTPVGDSIEAAAIVETYGRAHRDGDPLWVGNVKPIIGHTQAAAGVLGIIHTVVSMQRERLPAMPSAGPLNRNVDWSAETVRVADRARAWVRGDRPRRAAISAFGVGTNAHVILEEAPPSPPPPQPSPSTVDVASTWPLVVSGKTESALRDQARKMAAFLEQNTAELRDVAFSAAVHRTHFRHRAAVLARRREDAITMLHAVAGGATMVLGSEGDVGLRAAAEDHVRGASVDWAAVFGEKGRFLPIPTYAFQRRSYWLEGPATEGALASLPSDDARIARLVRMSEEDRRADLLELIRAETAAVLGLPDPASLVLDRSLFQLGLDSLRATTLRHRLRAKTGVLLPTTHVFERPTVEAIVKRVAQALAEPPADAPVYEEFVV